MSWECGVCGGGHSESHTNCQLVATMRGLTNAIEEMTKAINAGKK